MNISDILLNFKQKCASILVVTGESALRIDFTILIFSNQTSL